MPSTDEATARKVRSWFGGGPGLDCMCEHVLKLQGFTVDKHWVIRKPTASHSMTDEQHLMVKYLVEEWDYGFSTQPLTWTNLFSGRVYHWDDEQSCWVWSGLLVPPIRGEN